MLQGARAMDITVDGKAVFAATGGRRFEPGRPSVVFVHGGGLDHTVWALQTRYFAYHGARQVENGWIWKVDPLIATGFGPFKPQWIGPNWKHLRAPMLAMIGSEPDTWGPIPEPTRLKRLSHVPQVEHAVIQDAGHFSHMEQPQAVADVVLAFLER